MEYGCVTICRKDLPFIVIIRQFMTLVRELTHELYGSYKRTGLKGVKTLQSRRRGDEKSESVTPG